MARNYNTDLATYEHIFFDLDHTLWDFETNSRETLFELFDHFNLVELGIPNAQLLYDTYARINEYYWGLYRQHLVSKSRLREERFTKTFEEFGIAAHEIPPTLPDTYIARCPLKAALMPNAVEVLEFLKKNYQLHIITNGFKETQSMKMRSSGIEHFFKIIIFSEDAGYQKPHPAIFRKAVNDAKCKIHQAIFVGDNLDADIIGSRNFGMDQVFYNPNALIHSEVVTFEIKNLIELKWIL